LYVHLTYPLKTAVASWAPSLTIIIIIIILLLPICLKRALLFFFFDTTAERERQGLKNQHFQIPNWCWNSRIALNELFNSLVLCGLRNYFTLLFTLLKWVDEISFLHHAIINKFNSVQFLFLHYAGYLHTICKVK